MPHVYSTATAGVDFARYKPKRPDMAANQIERKVTIHGGSNVANKNLFTPLGVVTQVTDDEAEFLKNHPAFKRMEERGFMRIRKNKADPEKIITSENMEIRDASAPKTPETIAAEGAKAFTGAAKKGDNE